MKYTPKKISQGFTLVEMLVIAPVVILAIGAFITIIVSMVGEVIVSRASNNLAYDVQDALNRIEQDVKLSSGFLAQNSITLDAANDQGYDDNDAAFTNVGLASGPALILNSLVTTGNPVSTSSGFVYLTNQPNACASNQISDNVPMTMNIVYFVKNNALWRRTIMPSNYANGASVSCATPWQQPSCTPANPTYTSAFCKADDVKLVDNLATNGFVVQYFTSESTTVADTVSVDTQASVTVRNTALQSINTVSVSILAEQTVSGKKIERSANLRASRLDINASSIATPVVDTVTVVPNNVAATSNTPGQITVSWDPAGASSYTLQYSTASDMSNPSVVNNITGTSYTITGLTQPRYYIQVRAVNGVGTGNWSTTANSWATITNGLVALWRLNGDTADSSGNNYNLNPVGSGSSTSTTGQNGVGASARSFASGQGLVSNSFANVQNQLTLSGWIRPTSYPSERSTLFVTLLNSNATYAYFMSLNSDGSLQNYWYNTSPAGYHSSGAGTVPLNTWTHITVSWSGTQAKLYTNGVLRNTVAVTGIGTASNIIYVAHDVNQPTRPYIGAMDDMRIYNRALTDAEVMGLFTAGAM